ncbi:hypothetical protein SBON0708_003913 [Salmonella bongori serovar 48:i:- str. 94-0708]|uniref:hypothetical protein n=1 Tax=Salmonella bongori TaxID=54736 RepID=UPI0009A9C9B7|nr:hypothetical protein [Salmonella bongori]EGE4660732.1 hypothetical protein [Salmonella bongori serovar 48:i:- str. 94-0708]
MKPGSGNHQNASGNPVLQGGEQSMGKLPGSEICMKMEYQEGGAESRLKLRVNNQQTKWNVS